MGEDLNMKIAHLFQAHFFSKQAIPFFCNNFQEYKFDCIVLYRPSDPPEYKSIEGAISIPVNNVRETLSLLRKTLQEYDLVVIHSLFIRTLEKIVLGLFYPKLIKKIAWVVWGYDLYLNREPGLVGWLRYRYNQLAQLVFDKKIPRFIGIHPVDLQTYSKEIRGKAILYFAPYRFTNNRDPFYSELEIIPISEKIKKGCPISIQLGHRSMKELDHISLLEKLGRYKDENIRIVIPLSYGDKGYANEVEKCAKSFFGDKVLILRDLLPVVEYRKLQSTIDILIINSMRQIALGNIHSMFYMCKGVFLPRGSLLSDYFKENGIPILDIEDIGHVTFKELLSDRDFSVEKEFIQKFDSENSAQIWKKVFNDMLRN